MTCVTLNVPNVLNVPMDFGAPGRYIYYDVTRVTLNVRNVLNVPMDFGVRGRYILRCDTYDLECP